MAKNNKSLPNGGTEQARSDRASPPWSRLSPTIEDEIDEDHIKSINSLNRNLPVLLAPEDAISIDDIEALIDETDKGSYSDPNYNKRLHEVGEIVEEFQKEKFARIHTNESISTSKPSPNMVETMNAVSEQFNEKLKNDSPFFKQTEYTEKDILQLQGFQ